MRFAGNTSDYERLVEKVCQLRDETMWLAQSLDEMTDWEDGHAPTPDPWQGIRSIGGLNSIANPQLQARLAKRAGRIHALCDIAGYGFVEVAEPEAPTEEERGLARWRPEVVISVSRPPMVDRPWPIGDLERLMQALLRTPVWVVRRGTDDTADRLVDWGERAAALESHGLHRLPPARYRRSVPWRPASPRRLGR